MGKIDLTSRDPFAAQQRFDTFDLLPHFLTWRGVGAHALELGLNGH
jgi:hypothetical protein